MAEGTQTSGQGEVGVEQSIDQMLSKYDTMINPYLLSKNELKKHTDKLIEL